MKGVIFANVGAEPKVVDDMAMPEPDDNQLLVKSLWTAINPVDAYCSTSGILVTAWPLTLGVDASGVVVKTGSKVSSSLKVGTHVFGCTRLGTPQYGTAAEYFLMDSAVTFALTPKMKERGIDEKAAATLGVSIDTAALGIFIGLKVPLEEANDGKAKDEWIVILGGASSVGKSGIQLAKAAGYNVLASCSVKSKPLVESLGAKVFDYKKTTDEQVEEILKITEGKTRRVFDAVAGNDPVVAKGLFKKLSGTGEKFFSTTNDWSGITDFEGGSTFGIQLGEVGRPEAKELNAQIKSFVPVLTELLENGKLGPGEYDVVGEGGFESAIEAYKYQLAGKGGSKKVIVKIQDA